MKLFLVSFVIVLSAALTVAPLTAESANITLKPSPTTLALSPVNSIADNVQLTNVTVNGGAITAPVTKGASVAVEFDWTRSHAGCPTCVIQFYIGFQGKPAVCVADTQPPDSGHARVTLTAPSVLGNALIMVDETADAQCDAVTSGGGGLGSIVGIVAVK